VNNELELVVTRYSKYINYDSQMDLLDDMMANLNSNVSGSPGDKCQNKTAEWTADICIVICQNGPDENAVI
jgi:hypothetical protein